MPDVPLETVLHVEQVLLFRPPPEVAPVQKLLATTLAASSV